LSAIALFAIASDAQSGFLIDVTSLRYPSVASKEFVVVVIRVCTRFRINTVLNRRSSAITISPAREARPAFCRGAREQGPSLLIPDLSEVDFIHASQAFELVLSPALDQIPDCEAELLSF
jgi:hypothetical protein